MSDEGDELDEVLYHTVVDPGDDERPSYCGCLILIVLAAVLVLFVFMLLT